MGLFEGLGDNASVVFSVVCWGKLKGSVCPWAVLVVPLRDHNVKAVLVCYLSNESYLVVRGKGRVGVSVFESLLGLGKVSVGVCIEVIYFLLRHLEHIRVLALYLRLSSVWLRVEHAHPTRHSKGRGFLAAGVCVLTH